MALLISAALPSPAAPASTNAPRTNSSAPRRLSYSDFSVVAERNIFNQRRYARRNNTYVRSDRPRSAEYVSLVGIMEYEKGPIAFFDSSNFQLRKVFKPGDIVAGYTLASVTAGSVKLSSPTNEFVMKVGTQLRRQEEGAWQLVAAPEAGPMTPAPSMSRSFNVASAPTPAPAPDPDQAANGDGPPPMAGMDPNNPGVPPDQFAGDPGSTNAAPEAAGGSDDPVLRRLMQRREQEMNR